MSLILAKEWLKSSHIDLESVKYIIEVEYLTSIVAFHSQQSIEKSLKALLSYNQLDVPKIHSLTKLFKICEDDIENENFDLISILDSLYIESRYPGDMGLLPHGRPTLKDAGEFYGFALNIFQEVCKKLDIDASTMAQNDTK